MAIDVPAETRTRRFTADEFWRMAEVGILGPDERLELIDGDIRVVSPSGWDHAWTVAEIGRRLGLAYGLEDHAVWMQSTVMGSDSYSPEPDVAVGPARGPWLAERRLPRVDEFLVVVEVSATSHHLDRRKVHLYAETGAPVYWIIDLVARTATAHSGPRTDGSWEHVQTVPQTGEIEIPRLGIALPVAEIMPPLEPSTGAKR